jgi:hypothetical protein
MRISRTHETVENPFKGQPENQVHRHNEEQEYIGGCIS